MYECLLYAHVRGMKYNKYNLIIIYNLHEYRVGAFANMIIVE